MIENLTNKASYKKNKNDLCIDDVLIDKFLLSENPHDEKIIKSNILINSLQDFMKKCEASYDKLYYEKNYAISLNEIFTLIQNSIFSQQQLDNYIYNINTDNIESNINCIKILNEKFINDLNYNIISIEKINNNYYCFNKIKKKNYKNKKLSSSRLFVTPHNIKNRINSIFNNIEKEIFINGYEILNGNYTLKEISTYSESIKSAKERNKSEKTNNNNNLLKGKNQKQKNNESKLVKKRVLSNQNKKYKDKKNSSKSKSVINENNLSNELRNISTFTSREITNNQKNRNSLLKLSNTSKTTKYDKNMKTFDIFKICQNMKKDKQKKNKDSGPLIRSNSSNLINDINDFNDNFLKKSLKSLGFSQINEKKKLSTGIKKIIISNTCKPTNLANHLLIKGKKYINEFNKMDEESKKWK